MNYPIGIFPGFGRLVNMKNNELVFRVIFPRFQCLGVCRFLNAIFLLRQFAECVRTHSSDLHN